MSVAPSRLPLLIAVSLLTAGLAVAGSPASLASESPDAERTSVAREEPERGPRNLALHGQVTNASSGEPIADVDLRIHNVWAEDGETKGRSSFYVTSDGDGRYRLNVSQGHVDLHIDDPRFQEARAEFTLWNDTELAVPMEPVSEDRARVHGTVTSGGEQPIEDAHVQISAVPEDCEDAEKCERHHRDARSSEERSTSREVATDEGNITFTYLPRQDRHVRAETDEQGRYEVRVPAGTYQVFVRAKEHLNERTSVDAPEGGSARADVALTPIPDASVTVEGRIVDERGEPIGAAEVRVDNLRWGTREQTRTNADGEYELAIEPGYAVVQIRAEASYRGACEEKRTHDGGGDANCGSRGERTQAYLPVSTAIQTSADETVRLDRALQPQPEPDARVDGWVVNASSGDPIPNASLEFRNEETGEWGRAPTGEDGSFQIDVDEGYYTVRVRAPGYFGNATNLAVDADAERITVELTPGEPADSRCCYVTPAEETALDGGAESGDGASAGPSGPSGSGEEVFAGGPGELGPPETASTSSDRMQNVPAVGALAVGAIAAASAVLARRARRS